MTARALHHTLSSDPSSKVSLETHLHHTLSHSNRKKKKLETLSRVLPQRGGGLSLPRARVLRRISRLSLRGHLRPNDGYRFRHTRILSRCTLEFPKCLLRVGATISSGVPEEPRETATRSSHRSSKPASQLLFFLLQNSTGKHPKPYVGRSASASGPSAASSVACAHDGCALICVSFLKLVYLRCHIFLKYMCPIWVYDREFKRTKSTCPVAFQHSISISPSSFKNRLNHAQHPTGNSQPRNVSGAVSSRKGACRLELVGLGRGPQSVPRTQRARAGACACTTQL